MSWVKNLVLPKDIPKLQISALGICCTREKCFRRERQVRNAAVLGRRTGREQARCLVTGVLCPVSCLQ